MKSTKTGKIILGAKEKESDVDGSMSISKLIGIIAYISIMCFLIVNIYLDYSSFYSMLKNTLE